MHNGYRILQEVVALTESLEEDFFKKEVDKRRMRLGAPSPEVIRKEVFLETFKRSKVGNCFLLCVFALKGLSYSYRLCTSQY